MILLLCMTVGMFGVSCTGDDGAQGPKGDTGEQGPPGESGEGASPEDTTGLYDFLKQWGSKTGEISCTDPILTGMGMFPGPDELAPLVNSATGQPAPVAFAAQCSAVLFDEMPAATVAPMYPAAELVFIKTGTAMETNRNNPEVIPSTEVSLAKTVVSTKHFAGGTLAADMSTKGGNDEVFERMRLHDDCRIGTAPSAVAGEWRSVYITKVTTPYNAQKVAQSTTTERTRKVCIRLDSLPGVVKCFIEMDPNIAAGSTGDLVQQIALYDGMAEAGMEITTVIAGKDQTPADNTANDKVLDPLPGTITNQEQENFFATGADFNLSIADTGQLCRFFEEGAR